jgi:hypothetical protein
MKVDGNFYQLAKGSTGGKNLLLPMEKVRERTEKFGRLKHPVPTKRVRRRES